MKGGDQPFRQSLKTTQRGEGKGKVSGLQQGMKTRGEDSVGGWFDTGSAENGPRSITIHRIKPGRGFDLRLRIILPQGCDRTLKRVWGKGEEARNHLAYSRESPPPSCQKKQSSIKR